MARTLLISYSLEPTQQIWADAFQQHDLSGIEIVALMGVQTGPLAALFPDAATVPIHSFLESDSNCFGWADVMSSYVALSKRPDFTAFLVTLQTALNRYDQSGTFRNLDREVVIRRTALQYLRILTSQRVEALLFDHVPHSFESLMMDGLGRMLGLSRLYFESIKYAPVIFPLTEIGFEKVFFGPERRAQSDELDFINEQLITSLHDYIAIVDSDWEVPPYMAFTTQKNKRPNLRSRVRALRPNRYHDYTFLPSLGNRYPTIRHLLTRFLTGLYRASLRRALREESVQPSTQAQEPGNPFVLFPLQYEPERTSLPEGLPVLHQIDAVVEARRLIPDEITLVVKEHPSQTDAGQQGIYNGRSPFFYDVVSSLPNTYLLESSSLAKSTLRSALAVFTLTGTPAVEAALRGIPAFYFGSPWWSGMPGSRRIPFDLDMFSDFLSAFPPRAERAEILNFFVDRILSFGIPFPPDIARALAPGANTPSPEREKKFQNVSIAALAQVLDAWGSKADSIGLGAGSAR